MMEKLVVENDALTDHLNRQALELSGLRSAMAAAAQFAQAADADAAAAEAAAAAVGYLPPASPMRQQSGGLGGLQRAVSDASAAMAAVAGLPSPRPTSAASPHSPLPATVSTGSMVAAAALQAPAGRPGGGGPAWELPGGVMLSEAQLQLLALAEEVSCGGWASRGGCTETIPSRAWVCLVGACPPVIQPNILLSPAPPPPCPPRWRSCSWRWRSSGAATRT